MLSTLLGLVLENPTLRDRDVASGRHRPVGREVFILSAISTAFTQALEWVFQGLQAEKGAVLFRCFGTMSRRSREKAGEGGVGGRGRGGGLGPQDPDRPLGAWLEGPPGSLVFEGVRALDPEREGADFEL